MLASTLIERFVFRGAALTAQYLALYTETYGSPGQPLPETAPPPGASRFHAQTMATTLREWAQRLDSSGVQVHQEGAIARFGGAIGAEAMGRHPGAVASRAKTLGFYRRVLEAAVGSARARSYTIPASSWQGAAVALTEAQASARAYHAAAAALTAQWPSVEERPELAGVAPDPKALEAQAGRAAAMHQTAVAEALSCLHAAEAGPWLRIATTPEDLPSGALIVGVEVGKGSPLLPHLIANLDPQHGGGVFGLGGQPGGKSATEAAARLYAGGLRLPRTTLFVTPRMDPDALAAAMILAGRFPGLHLEGPGWGIFEELSELDSSEITGTWAPGPMAPQSVADHVFWGAVGAMCLDFTRGGPTPPTLEELEAACIQTAHKTARGLFAQRVRRQEEQWAAAQRLSPTITGAVACLIDAPIGAGVMARCYAEAPIAVLQATRFPFRGQDPGTKYTVAVHRGAHCATDFVREFRSRITALEPGWGGADTITGSPFGGSSRLTLDQVVDAAQVAAQFVGVGTSVGRLRPSGLR